MSPPVFVSAAEPACVGRGVDRGHLTRWLGWALGPDADTRQLARLATAVRRAGVDRRHTCVADHLHLDDDALTLYTRGGDGVLRAPLDRRMALFRQVGTTAARHMLAPTTDAPDHLLQVSCTGYSAPGVVQVAAAERGWADIRILSLGHIGCHAAVPALRTAADAVRATATRHDRPATAAVLHVECCSLHLQPHATERAWMTHAALFADGAARVDVTTDRPRNGFELLDDFEILVPGSGPALTWQPGPEAFRMHLGNEVVARLRDAVRPATEAFLHRNSLGLGDIGAFAIHPGGPRILETCADRLSLGPDAHRHASAVFRSNGNLSSATVPHIWAALLADRTVADGQLVCTLAFGPGLTVTGNLLRVVRA